MKNYDCWKKFLGTGKINDYLNYIACTQEESVEEFVQEIDATILNAEKDKEGGVIASINYCDRNGFVGHAGW